MHVSGLFWFDGSSLVVLNLCKDFFRGIVSKRVELMVFVVGGLGGSMGHRSRNSDRGRREAGTSKQADVT